ncbi:MAG: low molecular weight phosphotyrosine protein phosphatase, partial [Clostridia bacterium]|nr:low molecular weight phosphotyrosine protein phosphatase [Clostridia bacterium]
MAEMVLKSVVREKGLESDYLIESSATSTEEIGNSIYPPARAELSINGIDIEPHRAVRFKPSDYDRFDYIICMDRWNKRNLMNIIGNDPENKVKLF